MTDQPIDLDAIRARHDDPESCADTRAMLAALDKRDAEVRRLTDELATMTAVAESNKRYVQSMYQDLQQAQQQAAARIAAELATVDPPEWAFAGQYGGHDAIRIARAVGAGCNCENADEPGHYVDHLTTAPRATPCQAPHPVAESARCELPASHDGWHAANVGSWPGSNWPPATDPAAVSGNQNPPCADCGMPHAAEGRPAEVCRRVRAYGGVYADSKPDPAAVCTCPGMHAGFDLCPSCPTCPTCPAAVSGA